MRIITTVLLIGGFSIAVLGREPCRSDKSSATCRLEVDAPADATVFINDYRTRSIGSRRHFYTAGLTPGKSYRYRVRFEHATDGQMSDRTVIVRIRAGDKANVSYESAQPVEPLTPKPNTEPSAPEKSKPDLNDPFATDG